MYIYSWAIVLCKVPEQKLRLISFILSLFLSNQDLLDSVVVTPPKIMMFKNVSKLPFVPQKQNYLPLSSSTKNN